MNKLSNKVAPRRMSLEQAAREVIRQHSMECLSDKAVDALRKALEQPDEIDWIKTNKALAKEIIELQKQAEQSQQADASLEPVAVVVDESEKQTNTMSWILSLPLPVGTKLYAAPLAQQDTHATHVVRTQDPCHPWQDLTDDEIWKELVAIQASSLKRSWLTFARAVIAADREKNK